MLLHSIRSRLLGLVLATVVPFTGLIGFGFWNQWRNDQATAIARATDEARLLAAQVDDHIGNLENLLAGLSAAVSTNPADAGANDALLRQARAELPDFIASILLFSPDGSNIGRSGDTALARSNATNPCIFPTGVGGPASCGRRSDLGVPNGRWIATVARPIEDQSGQLRAMIAVGTFLDHFQDALRLQRLPAGSLVEIVDEKGIGIARSADSLDWIGRDLSKVDPIARHIAAKEISEIVRWSDDVERITGSSTANKVPWLVVVGLPTDIAFAAVASRLTWSALFVAGTLMAAFAIAWTLSGRIVRPLRQLGKDASTLAAGDLGHRTAVRTHDEVGALADNFNRMADHSIAARTRPAAARKNCGKPRTRWRPSSMRRRSRSSAPILIAAYFFGAARPRRFSATPPKKRPGSAATWYRLKSGDETHQLFERAINGETLRNLRLKKRRKDGSLVHIRASAAPMYNPDGTVRGVARAYEDITNQVRAEAQLERVAHYDQLTGLPNRLSLQKELGRRLSGEGYSNPTSIMLFDLDGFKDVNDTLGHSTGDQLLVEVGERLAEAAGPTRAVCRLGGDEFVVIVPDCGDPLTVGPLADAMLKRLAEPFKINDHVLHVGGSAGIAIAPDDGANVDELIANADLALYQAKSEGGRTYRFFLPVLRAQAQARRSLDLELRRAFAENEFELYFQPQVRLADGAVVGAEALLRWHHPVRGILAPGVFIETLAVSAIAPEVSRWIIRTACEKTAAWRAEGLALSRIGVNLFPCQLSGETLLKDIGDALQDSNLPTEILELEITENVALNFERATVLRKLHEKGVKLAFDDFGTGYASLSYL